MHLNLPGNFIHGIHLGNALACWKMSLAGYITSPNWAALSDKNLWQHHKMPQLIPIEELRNEGARGLLAPRVSSFIQMAVLFRKYRTIVNGYGDEIIYSEQHKALVIKKADIELVFEEVRRRLNTTDASRLSCLWVAENTAAGKQHIKNMLGDDVYIMEVKVPYALSVFKADTTWFDKYYNDPQLEYIEKYWQGAAFDSADPKWEYLIDGAIQISAEDQVYLKQYGSLL